MKKARKLKDIDVEEISLVDSAATRKKFFIIKRSKNMKKFKEILAKFFGDEIKEEDIKKAEGIEEDAQKALGDALETIDEYRDDYTPDVHGAILKIAKAAVTPKEKVEEPDFVAELINTEKAGARLSKATIAQLKKIGEIVAAMIGAAEKAIGKGEGDEDGMSPELVAKLEKLAIFEAAEKLEKQKIADKKIDDLTTDIEELKKQLKKKPTKKGLESDEKDEEDLDKIKKAGGDKEEFQWSSLTSPDEEED